MLGYAPPIPLLSSGQIFSRSREGDSLFFGFDLLALNHSVTDVFLLGHLLKIKLPRLFVEEIALASSPLRI